ncbi:MAG: hypothetical protein C0446_08505 [Chitinophaga sp.]|nr:hypothetical protein [Chitinophaga sp.]
MKTIQKYEDYIPDGSYILWSGDIGAVFRDKMSYKLVELNSKAVYLNKISGDFNKARHILDFLVRFDGGALKVLIDDRKNVVIGIPRRYTNVDFLKLLNVLEKLSLVSEVKPSHIFNYKFENPLKLYRSGI